VEVVDYPIKSLMVKMRESKREKEREGGIEERENEIVI
jgi:hypothetical protein